jgi:8-oxo-dGTP pyrophosphatase MutT (NUDIX family)
MSKNKQKVVRLSDFSDKHTRVGEAAPPNWGRVGSVLSPDILPAPHEKRPTRHSRIFVGDRPSRLLSALMASPTIGRPVVTGEPILETGALACRRLKNGKLSILLVSKRRSGKWGIPKGRVNGRLTFPEVAAKEAFEEAGVRGKVSPNSIGMFRTKKRTPDRQHVRVVEVWVYLMRVTELLKCWPEMGKREIRWVSCGAAARALREPILAELCDRLAGN